MIPTHSEGLRMYRERCQAAMPDSVRDGPWIEESDWVEANVPLETLADVRRQAGKDLAALNLAMDEVGLTEHPLEDSLWTVIQILARAMPHGWDPRSPE